MSELLIHRDGEIYTYSEMLLLTAQMREAVAVGRRQRKDKYAKLEPNFEQGKHVTPSAASGEANNDLKRDSHSY